MPSKPRGGVIGVVPRIPWSIPGEQKILTRFTEGKAMATARASFRTVALMKLGRGL
jgi:hypothetical protein